jgi:hypothetical protein
VDVVSESWKEMEERAGEIARTKIAPLTAETQSNGTIVEIAVRNEGQTDLGSFPRWDIIVQYYGDNSTYHIQHLSYTPDAAPDDNEWTVEGIYLDAQTSDPEIFEPAILNPEEEMVIRMKVDPPVGGNTTNLATIATPNGVDGSIMFAG